MDGQMEDGWVDGGRKGRTDGWIEGRWMDRRADGGWMGRWREGRKDR